MTAVPPSKHDMAEFENPAFDTGDPAWPLTRFGRRRKPFLGPEKGSRYEIAMQNIFGDIGAPDIPKNIEYYF